MSARPVDLFSLSFDELRVIACDLAHPQRRDADELLTEWEADDAARYTPAGGAA
jgi:hypothetical protein